MTEPIRTIENPDVMFTDSPLSMTADEATIYPSGVVVLKSASTGDKHYYPPNRAPVVKD